MCPLAAGTLPQMRTNRARKVVVGIGGAGEPGSLDGNGEKMSGWTAWRVDRRRLRGGPPLSPRTDRISGIWFFFPITGHLLNSTGWPVDSHTLFAVRPSIQIRQRRRPA